MAKKLIAIAMVAAMAILIAFALVTLAPHTASTGNDLGYTSVCPFAPWSTLILLLGAAIAWGVRSYIVTRVD
jgi:hypothetical protein